MSEQTTIRGFGEFRVVPATAPLWCCPLCHATTADTVEHARWHSELDDTFEGLFA